MPKRILRHYQRRRIININVNVVTAGLLSIALAKYPVALLGQWIGHEHKLLITVLAYALDTLVDVAIYFGLHWVANHWRPVFLHGEPLRPAHAGEPVPARARSYIEDVGRIQAERLALVPLFAGVAMGMMYGLQKLFEIRPSWAFVFGFLTAILITRIVHTAMGWYVTGSFRDEQTGTLGNAGAAGEPGSSKAGPGDDGTTTRTAGFATEPRQSIDPTAPGASDASHSADDPERVA